MTGKRVKRVKVHRRDLRVPIPLELKSVLEGRRIEGMTRRGKYIVIFAEGRSCVVLHLGMSGRISIFKAGQSYKKAKHDHVVFEMEDGTMVVFNDPRRFGMLYLADGKTWASEAPFCNMGPEPLMNDFSAPVLHGALKRRRTPIKSALLDQRVVAGLGNIYVCEALYYSGIHPETSACDISLRSVEKLTCAIRDVLEKAISSGGSTLRDYQKTDGSLGYFQHSFAVYDREKSACPECDCDISRTDGIKRIVQSGRSTFYCAGKQKQKKTGTA